MDLDEVGGHGFIVLLADGVVGVEDVLERLAEVLVGQILRVARGLID